MCLKQRPRHVQRDALSSLPLETHSRRPRGCTSAQGALHGNYGWCKGAAARQAHWISRSWQTGRHPGRQHGRARGHAHVQRHLAFSLLHAPQPGDGRVGSWQATCVRQKTHHDGRVCSQGESSCVGSQDQVAPGQCHGGQVRKEQSARRRGAGPANWACGGEGPPSCRAPQGHDQTCDIFSIFWARGGEAPKLPRAGSSQRWGGKIGGIIPGVYPSTIPGDCP
mmetsp:Transcript_61207/g.99030  ORF Transcript_61207/g.99030 Transcript_61207/m.99030 type:complete len:223 (-) Transcript_61207:242-910(-)